MSSQLQKLNDLIHAILPANRFYAEKLGSPGDFTSLSDFTQNVPFTTKEELAADHEQHPPYGTTHTFPLARYYRFHQTSGTRGKPLIWLDETDGWSWILDNWEWVWRGAGVKAGDTAFFPFSFGPFLGFWAGFEAATCMGVRAVPGGGLSSEDRLHLLLRSQSSILCCTPTYALRLAEVGEKIKLPVSSLGIRKIIHFPPSSLRRLLRHLLRQRLRRSRRLRRPRKLRPAGRFDPMALSGACRRKQIPRSKEIHDFGVGDFGTHSYSGTGKGENDPKHTRKAERLAKKYEGIPFVEATFTELAQPAVK